MRKRTEKRKGSLLRTYITIVAVVCSVILLSFLLTYLIINKWYLKEAEQSAQARFIQAQENAAEAENDISNLYSTVTSGEAVLAYLKSGELAERTERLKDLSQLTGSIMKINPDVEAIMLYDAADRLVATRGTLFFPRQEGIETNGMYGFSGKIMDKETGYSYFQVEMPVYNRGDTGSYNKLGSVVLLFASSGLQDIVDTLSLNEETYSAVLDRNGEALAAAGNWKEEYAQLLDGSDGQNIQNKYLLYSAPLNKSGWRIVNLVPKSSFMNYVNQIQMINLLTYALVAAALIAICVLMYHKVVQPIRRQMEFVSGYTRDTNQRLAVAENNEFGEMAEKINEMLDGLETMNRQIVEGERKYLELDYAKKQTEMIAYKGQINPHFMYNTLECIRGMALYHEEKEIAKLTGSLSKLFRYNVKGDELVTVKEVIKNLREYALIIDYRFMGKFKVQIQAEETLLQQVLPKMLVQPLVENAVLHGLEPKMEKGQVDVRFSDDGEEGIRITVEDDGCGMKKEELAALRAQMEAYNEEQAYGKSGHGIGVSNVYRRIRLFYGEYAQFKIESEENRGTCITMRLPKRMGD
ncbi:cache domain-containing sensor histidine kinase [Eisenbergiella sp.]